MARTDLEERLRQADLDLGDPAAAVVRNQLFDLWLQTGQLDKAEEKLEVPLA